MINRLADQWNWVGRFLLRRWQRRWFDVFQRRESLSESHWGRSTTHSHRDWGTAQSWVRTLVRTLVLHVGYLWTVLPTIHFLLFNTAVFSLEFFWSINTYFEEILLINVDQTSPFVYEKLPKITFMFLQFSFFYYSFHCYHRTEYSQSFFNFLKIFFVFVFIV